MTQAPKTHPHHQEKHNLSHGWILFFRSRVFARVYTLSVVRDVTSLLIGRFFFLDRGMTLCMGSEKPGWMELDLRYSL